MSINVIKSQIKKFLATNTPEVMAIKGAWGVGKTYSWKKFLCEAKTDSSIALNRYSYVSLFGVNSLEALKYTIFENIIGKDLIGTEASIATFKDNTTDLLETMGRKSLGFFKGMSRLKDFTPAIDSLSFLSLNKTLICIDDLERKGSSLSIKDVLGLISLLKEQKKCKIVLLLNDSEEGLEDYIKYREKVIDIELMFAPTAEECTNIAYDGKGYVYEKLTELTNKLDIKNIRILKKIEKLINLAMPYLEDYEQEITYQFIHSLTLFSWCYYSSMKEVPSLDFVTNLGYGFLGIGDDKKESDEITQWKIMLGQYGYQNTDELDLILAEAVRTGYFVENKLKEEALKKNALIVATKSEGAFSEAWRLYHESFSSNQDEVISTLYESFKRNAKYISPLNLNGTVTLFRELGENEKASELINFYIEIRKNERELFDIESNYFFGDACDKEIVDKFNAQYFTAVSDEKAAQVLARISGRNGWNQKDEVILANTTIDEYYELFKSETGRHLSSYVNTCLRFGQSSNASEQQRQIAIRVKGALQRIASESEINRRRVKKFGVEIDGA
jgi:hypothetical protein